jgi:hypothetical protein
MSPDRTSLAANHMLQVRPVSLKPEPHKGCGGSGAESSVIFDNLISVQVEFLPLRCRGERVSPAVATDHQSAKRGSKAVTWNPTRNPVERS